MPSYVGKGLGLMIRKSGHSKETRCLKDGRGNHPPAVPSLIWDVQRHVTPPTTQATRSETPTVAGVSEAWPCVFGGKGNNLGAAKNVGSLDLVYKSESRKRCFGGVVVG